MMTVNEVSKITGMSIRALQYYDSIGLLKSANYTNSGYRLYDDTSLEKLGQILLFRELEFPLKEIKKILASPSFDREKALKQQIKMLELKKEHIENLIEFARQIKRKGAEKWILKHLIRKNKMNTPKQPESSGANQRNTANLKKSKKEKPIFKKVI